MAWNNRPLTLYHGTDDLGAAAILQPSPPLKHSINLSLCSALTDFGQGFYTTTNLRQAKSWANTRYLLGQQRPTNKPSCATVLTFKVDRNSLASMHSMTFVTEGSLRGDFWDLVSHCRNQVGPHMSHGHSNYDVVFGPVTNWPQTFVIKDCDQISFHTIQSLVILPKPKQSKGKPIF